MKETKMCAVLMVTVLLSIVCLSGNGTASLTTVDSDNDYAGFVSYGRHIQSNSDGDLVIFYGNGSQCGRLTCRYSTNEGSTWSDPIVLFSRSDTADGIINKTVGARYDLDTVVRFDTLYLVVVIESLDPPYGIPYQIAFTKCDISTISNVGYYQNWKTMWGRCANGSGIGINTYGYQLIGNAYDKNPSIAVNMDGEALVTCINAYNSSTQYGIHSNGWHWSYRTPIRNWHELGSILEVPRVTSYNGSEFCHSALISDGGEPEVKDIVVQNLDYIECTSVSYSEPETRYLVLWNWTDMEGNNEYDYVISIEGVEFSWPVMITDGDSYIHVLAISDWVSGWCRIYHNYWDQDEWQNGNSHGSAGAYLDDGTNHPRTPNTYGRNLNINVDGSGELVICFNDLGIGMRTLKWDGTWDYESYENHTTTTSHMISAQGYMAGCQEDAYFIACDSSYTTIYMVDASNADSGSPWWEED